MKIFLTGDNHIGLKYASHEQAAILVASRISAFDAMVHRANQEICDLFVVAGDLFENTYSISKKDVKVLVDILSRFRGYVAVLPGNHDYYEKGVKVWQYFTDLAAIYDNILLLSDYRPYPLEIGESQVILYPALCTSLHSAPGQNNLNWIRETDISDNKAYHIGIAHGAVAGETIDNEGQYFLMTREELEAIPVDVWLIGHTHVPFSKDLTKNFSRSGKIYNAGTHVQTDVSCNTEGFCFVLEVNADKSVEAKKIVSGNIRFYRKQIGFSAGTMEDTLERELADLPDNCVVDLIFSGSVTADEYACRHGVFEKALSRFIEGTYDDYALSKCRTSQTVLRIDTGMCKTTSGDLPNLP